MAGSSDFWGVVIRQGARRRPPFRLTPGKVILLAAVVGLVWLIVAYIDGVRFQMSGFSSDFEAPVNRNLLGSWEDGERFGIFSRKWCAPGAEPGWPRTRQQCAFVGGAVRG